MAFPAATQNSPRIDARFNFFKGHRRQMQSESGGTQIGAPSVESSKKPRARKPLENFAPLVHARVARRRLRRLQASNLRRNRQGDSIHNAHARLSPRTALRSNTNDRSETSTKTEELITLKNSVDLREPRERDEKTRPSSLDKLGQSRTVRRSRPENVLGTPGNY
jgi:hypothetical protein